MSDDVVVTDEVLDHLMHLLSEVIPEEINALAEFIPEDRRDEALSLIMRIVITETTTATHAGALAVISMGRQEDGSVALTAPQAAGIVAESVKYLISKGKQ
jgi:hypothetical protein